MALWGKYDNAANSDIAAVIQYNEAPTSANQTSLYDNTTANAFITNQIVGQFGIDTNEARANKDIPHSGWVLRKEGTGLRAGRVTYEVLVATGSITGDGSDDTWIPDYKLTITTNPTSSTSNVVGNKTFTVSASSTPSGGTISYRWQKYNGASWVNVPNTAGQYINNTSPTFTANNLTANGNVFRAMVSVSGGNTVYSGSATILYVV
jgi:hypothetical protein